MSNVKELSFLIGEALHIPGINFNSLEQLLVFLFEAASDKTVILAIDEYPYIRKMLNGMDSIFQKYIDKYKNKSKLKIILLGSYIDIMKSMIEYSSPLFGRFSLVLDIKQQSYYEASKYYDSYSLEEKVFLYSVLGGIPYYNSLVDSKKTPLENIISLIINENGILNFESEIILGAELTKINGANEVLQTIAKGYKKFTDIQSNSHIDKSNVLTNILKTLEAMDLIYKSSPINAQGNTKKTFYLLNDNFLLFYYKFIFPNKSRRKVMTALDFYKMYIETSLAVTVVPKTFELICSQYLIRRNKAGLNNPLFEEIGKYWYDDPVNHINGEFDVVTIDKNGNNFYEAKYLSAPITDTIIKEEENQLEKLNISYSKLGFFSKSGYNLSKKYKYEFYTLQDIYTDF
jgi:AAA+ ATPase superfamily predicted ATPase